MPRTEGSEFDTTLVVLTPMLHHQLNPAPHVFEVTGPVHDIDNIAMERAADLIGEEIGWNPRKNERGVWTGKVPRRRARLFRETE